MTFRETKLPGVFEIRIEPISDERGFFARSWCRKDFEAQGLNPQLVQCNISVSRR
jgi:dTDP-4-dehydrorhamnose 3,5-epimerase